MSIFILHGFIKTSLWSWKRRRPSTLQPDAHVFQRRTAAVAAAFITVLILNGIWIWNDFLLPLLILGSNGKVQTIPLAVTSFAGSYLKQWDLILTSTLLAMLPIIVLFIFAQRYIIKGMVEGSIK
jgi:raffinose/stachyose/melibiose transport system permease protein